MTEPIVRPPTFTLGDRLLVLSNQSAHQVRRPDGSEIPAGTELTVCAVVLDKVYGNMVTSNMKPATSYAYGFSECCDACRQGAPHHIFFNEHNFFAKMDNEGHSRLVSADGKPYAGVVLYPGKGSEDIKPAPSAKDEKPKEPIVFLKMNAIVDLMHTFSRFWGATRLESKTVTAGNYQYRAGVSVLEISSENKVAIQYTQERIPRGAVLPLINLYESYGSVFTRVKQLEELILKESSEIKKFEEAN